MCSITKFCNIRLKYILYVQEERPIIFLCVSDSLTNARKFNGKYNNEEMLVNLKETTVFLQNIGIRLRNK